MPRNLKTLFINPPWYRLQGLISTYPPMGASYMAAVLEQNGYESLIWNADYSETRVERISAGSHSRDDAEMTKSFEKYKNILNGLTHPIWKEVEDTIRRVNPGIVGVTVNTSALKSAANIALIAKKINPDIKVVFGGPHPTILPEETIRTENVDYVIRGEGETSFLGLINSIAGGKTDFSGIPGLTYMKDGVVTSNPRAANYEDPDSLPMPAKHLYLDRHKLPADVFSPIFTSRGCPFSCIYCGSFNIHGRKPRFRSPEKVIRELEIIRNDFNCYNIVFCDDTFGVNLKHTNAILDAIIDSGLDITWVCQTRGVPPGINRR